MSAEQMDAATINQSLSLAKTHMFQAASLSNKATIMAIIGAILAIVAAVGFKVNSTVILGAAGLIVSGVLALIHAAQTHTLFAMRLMDGTGMSNAINQLTTVLAANSSKNMPTMTIPGSPEEASS